MVLSWLLKSKIYWSKKHLDCPGFEPERGDEDCEENLHRTALSELSYSLIRYFSNVWVGRAENVHRIRTGRVVKNVCMAKSANNPFTQRDGQNWELIFQPNWMKVKMWSHGGAGQPPQSSCTTSATINNQRKPENDQQSRQTRKRLAINADQKTINIYLIFPIW